MNRISTLCLTAALAASTLSVGARTLSPAEALEAVRSTTQIDGLRKVAARQVDLSMTLTDDSATPTVYVFAQREGAGYMVVAADDAVSDLLLGYSDAAFDSANMAPAMKWWLEGYSRQVAYEASRDQSRRALTMARRADRASIAPLCQTKWNQSSPYNNECPVLGGQRAVTGCVATAMAQVLKYHEWPQTGTGTSSYTYTYNNATQTESFNFGATTFDWGEMLNVYNSSATAGQNAAVATLMHACGVAAKMNYGPSESGASDYTAGSGLVDYLGYDKGIRYLEHDWFVDADWNDLVYAELAAGRPVLYGGTDGSGGHEFVCDGYSSDDYFHINWGWGGMADGYFKLTALQPSSQGIGGSSGDGGFNYHQSILANVKPTEGSASYAPLMIMGDILTTDKTSYTRNSSTNVTFKGGFYNYAYGTVSYDIGLKLLKDDGTESYLTIYTGRSIQQNYGYSTLSVAATSFPVGTYKVSPVCKTSSTDWQPIYNNAMYNNYVAMNVTSTAINAVSDNPDAKISGELNSITPVFPNDGSNIYITHPYDFNFTISADGPISQTLYMGILNSSNQIVDLTDYAVFTFPSAGGSVEHTWNYTIPNGLSAGTYYVGLIYASGSSYYAASSFYPITVSAAPANGSGSVTSVAFPGGTGTGNTSTNPASLSVLHPKIEMTVKCTAGPWDDFLTLVFADASSLQVLSSAEYQMISMVKNETKTLTFEGPWASLEPDVTYVVVPWSKLSGQVSAPFKYVMFDPATGVESVSADAVGDATYYNLQGQRVDTPQSGMVVIERRGGEVKKIVLK